nr:hypothetical protein [Tanacetum cinerariifolium]
MRILEQMLTKEMKLTNHYKVYVEEFGIDVLMTQSHRLAGHIDIASLDEATQMSIATARRAEDFNANKFVDNILNNQEDPGTRIKPSSYKERLEAEKSVAYMTIDEKVEEKSAEDALLRKKGKDEMLGEQCEWKTTTKKIGSSRIIDP